MNPRILVINGSLGGRNGNTGSVLGKFQKYLEPHAQLQELVLLESLDSIISTSGAMTRDLDRARIAVLNQELESSDGFIFATGTYWDSWGSPLQRFLELMTSTEASSAWIGKPAAVLVTEHSVGGKGVLTRLQGVLSTLGCVIPPMSGLVYSMTSHLALQGPENEFHDDFWQLNDLEIIAHNLLEATGDRRRWRPWGVDRRDPTRRWFFN